MFQDSKQCRLGPEVEASGPPAHSIALWPPFSVGTTGVSTKTHQTIAGIDIRNQQLKFKNLDVNKRFKRVSEGREFESCSIQTFLSFISD